MPIYAYRCESCGHEKDVLRKLSDAPLTQCPSCGKDTFSKQVTAAGFQLKGSGWYVTDFRGGNSNNGSGKNAGADAANSDSAASGSDKASDSKPAESASTASAPSSEASKPASSTNTSTGSNAAASGTA